MKDDRKTFVELLHNNCNEVIKNYNKDHAIKVHKLFKEYDKKFRGSPLSARLEKKYDQIINKLYFSGYDFE